MVFSDWIAWQCSRRGVSQADLRRGISEHPAPVDITAAAVSRWFCGSAVPSAGSLVVLCDVLGLDATARARALQLIADHGMVA